MPDVEQSKDLTGVETANAAAAVGKAKDWPLACVTKSRKDIPLVTDAASKILTELLRGLLSERALKSGELTTLAKQLIDDMIPRVPPAKPDADTLA